MIPLSLTKKNNSQTEKTRCRTFIDKSQTEKIGVRLLLIKVRSEEK